MSKLKRLAGETVLYGLGSIVPRFLNFLLVPLHTNAFSPEQYGVLSKLLAYVAVLNVIFTFGMETAYFRFATKDGADEQKVFNLAQTVVVIISFVLSGALLLLAPSIAGIMDIAGHDDLVMWLAAIMFIDAVVAIPFARLRLKKKPLQFAVGKLTNIGLLMVLNFYFLKIAFNPSVGVGYVVLANLLANAFYLLFFARSLLSWRPVIDRSISPAMFSYAYPVMLTGLAGVTNEMFSRQTLDWWLPANFYANQTPARALGIFSACYKLAMLMNLTVQAFRYAAEPFFFSNAVDKNSPALFARVNHYFIIVCCVLLLGAGINLDILKYFLGNATYWEGVNIVPILLLAYLFLGVYYNLTVWFKLTDKTIYGTLITVGGAVVTIAANFLLIPTLGYLGSSIATLLCYFSMTVGCYLLGQKYYPIPYQVGKSMAYIIVTTAIVYATNSIIIPNFWVGTAVHGAIIVSFVLVVYLLEKNPFRQPAT
ncbi:lipopolysaccharide biosynthesis protein [Chryseolinea lacunae]|uniref:Polysaccharide biosynthesis C-terminal domain-containing protein n=1 Tax=Chryseolinea lacunae TaxID=2801331 RepID=A0ABS1KSJ9_9BACT|nr:polysaccharide biosynthesis C-terminal domain-containing protein [Chryseolinea lacunae]MBL0742325.1 polysaccharide biosynthesis C-terminal domain-containing protein [Chryseolinea lacunae]